MTQEKPWWRCCENEAFDGGACLNCGTDSQEHQKKIVEEATRRGKEEGKRGALENIYNLINKEIDEVDSVYTNPEKLNSAQYTWSLLSLRDKLSSLTKK